jgi:predicted lactoylglutathione lyase
MIEAALASGGSRWKPVQDHGFMYAGSFQDPDGHVWELVHMAPQG